ncbi:MAG: hypothetical protein LBI15_06875 [Dysgonamonadaceae bacterium]|jgi:hypothetical protein|nr:hypothetical protein [Dysgonamonadaceae bacterium]
METKLDKIINSYKTNNPFKVPNNYFSHFNEEIMSRLPEKEKKVAPQKTKRVSMWDKAKPLVYMAAMFAGLYFSINLLTKNSDFNLLTNRQAEQQQTLNSPNIDNHWASLHITEEEFFQFVEAQLAEYSYHEFLNQLHLN